MVTHDIAHVHFPEQIPFHGRVFYKHFVPKYLKRADRVVTVSHFTKRDIIRQYGIADEKMAVACNGCRETFQPLGDAEKEAIRKQYAEGKPYFFYLGAVHPRKNIPRLIRAFDHFKQQTGHEMKLLIAGRLAWQTGEVHEAYESISCKEDIVLLGYVPDDQLPKLMGGAFALTYLSLFEGFGVPLLEAMNCEIPIIGADAASIPEVVGNAGILVDPFDVSAISQSMQQIIEDEGLRIKLVEKGREQAKQFSWNQAAQVIYDNLLAMVS
jgi:glycosyltransferase involved in cell wall biosynthesis